jgi:hypothetical protein
VQQQDGLSGALVVDRELDAVALDAVQAQGST